MNGNLRGFSVVTIFITIVLISSLAVYTVPAVTREGSRQNSAPVAVIDSPDNGQNFEVDETITYDASSSYDPDNDTLSYSWNFGDGESGSGRTTTHSYAIPFVYVIRLTVSDGELNDTARPVVIIVGGGGGQNQPPSAEISSPSKKPTYPLWLRTLPHCLWKTTEK